MVNAGERNPLVPSSAIPSAYFAFAHAGLAAALAVLVVDPSVPGGFFYHPRPIALVHLVTLAWLTGSILGAFYIVAPLALRMALPAGPADWVGFAAFTLGTTGMVAHFWMGGYSGMVWSAQLVSAAIAWVALRAWRGLPRAMTPWPVKLHVALAFLNIMGAAALGIFIGIDRSTGFLGISPLGATFAHAHLAAVGWVTMMVVGLSYRLIPMIVPAAMPGGGSLAVSAILIEAGLAVLVLALIQQAGWLLAGTGLIVAGLASFVAQIRRTLKHRLPRPPALPRRDWSTWQTHTALLWLLVATVLGLTLSIGVAPEWRVPLMWAYGTAGLVGFLAQIVVGMEGRLVPLYAWYRAFAARGGVPPARGANELPSAAFARPVFLTWSAGVPLLGLGLAAGREHLIRLSAALLLCGVATGAAYVAHMLRSAAAAAPAPSTAPLVRRGGPGR